MKITFTITVDIDEQESVAKASEDNGVTTGAEADHVTGEASRLATGRTVAATSEIMDATGGESAATISPEQASTGAVTGLVDPPSTQTGSSDHRDVILPLTSGKISVTVVGTERGTVVDLKPVFVLRPHCLNPDACGGYSDKHCHACTKSLENAEETRQHIRAAFKGAVG